MRPEGTKRLAIPGLKQRPKTQLRLLGIEELQSLPDPSWLVDEILPEAGVTVLFGRRGPASPSLRSICHSQ
jgi:hypothetical protein